MKRFIMFVLLALTPALAQAEVSWSLGKGWKLNLNTSGDMTVHGAYDFRGHQWMSGYGRELFFLTRNDKKSLYIAARHMFLMKEAAKGVADLALGVPSGVLGEKLDDLTGLFVPDGKLPSWATKLGNFVSVEGGVGYRLYGVPAEASKFVYSLGGQINIPLGSFIRK